LPAETRGIGMSLWIVLCGLLLPRNMGAPCVVYWGRSAFPYCAA